MNPQMKTDLTDEHFNYHNRLHCLTVIGTICRPIMPIHTIYDYLACSPPIGVLP